MADLDNARARTAWVEGALLLIALTLTAYVPVLRAGFIWDDDQYVTDNPTLVTTEGLKQIWLDPRATPQYYPLVHTSYWVEYYLYEVDPRGYHLVNVVLHALAAVVLASVLARVRAPHPWLVALLFALHPVNVETVAWVTERKNTLSTLFYLLSAYALIPHFTAGDGAGRSAPRYLLGLLLFVAALLSKTVTCTLPVALLVLDLAERRSLLPSRRAVVAAVPLLLVGAALGLHTVYLEKTHVGASGMAWRLAPHEKVLVAGRALFFYASKLLWPSDLMFVYPRWRLGAEWWQWVSPAAALFVLGGLLAARRRIGVWPLAAVVLFAVALFPALGFFSVYPFKFSFVADHFQYLATPWLLALAVGSVSWSVRRALGEGPGVRRLGRAAAVLLVLGAGVMTARRCRHFESEETVWRDTIARNPRAGLALSNLGVLLHQRGRGALDTGGDLDAAIHDLEEALACQETSARLDAPDDWDTYRTHLNGALVRQSIVIALRLRARTRVERGLDAGARDDLLRAKDVEPATVPTYCELGGLLLTSKDPMVRSPDRALAVGREGFERSLGKSAHCLALVARAHEARSEPAEVLVTARQALDLARGEGVGLAPLVAELEELIARTERSSQPPR